jgi:hypothetical protein
VLIQATPELTISNGQNVVPGNESKVPIKIANTGNSAIRSAYVTIEPGADSDLRVTSGTEFIGTLNVDDSYTAQPIVAVPFATGSYPLSVTVTYRDSMNQERNVTKEIYLDVGNSGGFSGSGNTASFSGNGTFNRGQLSRNNTGGIRVFGIDIIPIVAVLIVLAIAYFIWIKKFKRKKEDQKK